MTTSVLATGIGRSKRWAFSLARETRTPPRTSASASAPPSQQCLQLAFIQQSSTLHNKQAFPSIPPTVQATARVDPEAPARPPDLFPPRMISDVTLAALANWLGGLTMVLIVLYHVSVSDVRTCGQLCLLCDARALTPHIIATAERSSLSMRSARRTRRRSRRSPATRSGSRNTKHRCILPTPQDGTGLSVQLPDATHDKAVKCGSSKQACTSCSFGLVLMQRGPRTCTR